MSTDKRIDPPEQPKTIEIASPPPWAIELMQRVTAGFTASEERFDRQDVTLDKVVNEGIEANVRMSRFESRLSKLESPSVPPPPALTSLRVREVIEQHPSQMDLETASKQAAEIVRGRERDRRIDETHALVMKAASKDDLAGLITKKDVEAVVEQATALQTTALINKISDNKKLQVIGGLVAALVIGWLSRVGYAAATPPPAPQVQAFTADAGAQ